MTDEPQHNGPSPDPDRLAEEDLGVPIAELQSLTVEADPGLLTRVVGSVRRRHLTSQLATLWWDGVAEIFVEFLRLFGGLAVTQRTAEEGEPS